MTCTFEERQEALAFKQEEVVEAVGEGLTLEERIARLEVMVLNLGLHNPACNVAHYKDEPCFCWQADADRVL